MMRLGCTEDEAIFALHDCNDDVIRATNLINKTRREMNITDNRDDFKKLHRIHFDGDCSDDESVLSEHSSCYEQYRPSPLTSDQMKGKVVVVEGQEGVPSTSRAFADIGVPNWRLTERNNNAGSGTSYTSQSVEMMITSGLCKLCNITIKSLYHAQTHIISEKHVTKEKYCAICLKNIEVKLVREHLQEDKHKQNAKLICLLCNVKGSSEKNMLQHMKASKHWKKKEELDKIFKFNTSNYNELLKNNGIKTETRQIPQNLKELTPNYLENMEMWEKNVKDVCIEADMHYCDICKIYLGPETVKSHCLEDEHKNNQERYCFVCDIKAPTKIHLLQHIQGSKHQNQVQKLKSDDMTMQLSNGNALAGVWLPDTTNYPLELKNLINKNKCKLCDAKLLQDDVRKSHYQSRKHKEKVKEWLQQNNKEQKPAQKNHNSVLYTPVPPALQIPTSIATTPEYSLSLSDFPELKPKVTKSVTSNIQNSQQRTITQNEAIVVNNANRINYCKLCCKNYTESDNHFQTAVHLDATEFLTLLIEKGIPPSNHEDILNEYHQELFLRADFCSFCKFGISDPDFIEKHLYTVFSSNHKKGVLKFIEEKNKTNMQLIPSEQPSEKVIDHLPDLSCNNNEIQKEIKSDVLSEQVLSEITKLANSLYFSKKMPLDKALEYLKRFNKEIEDCKNNVNSVQINNNVEVNNNPNNSKNPENNCFMPNFSNHFLVENLNAEPKENLTSDLMLQTEDGSLKETCVADNEELTINSSFKVESENSFNFAEVLIDLNDTEMPFNDKNGDTPGNTEKCKTTNNDNLIKDFINKKVSIALLAEKDNFLEIEVLTELTKLVDSVYSSGEIKLVQALACLESFNREVNQFLSEEVAS